MESSNSLGMMSHWDPVNFWIFVVANVVIFLSYAFLGYKHFRIKDIKNKSGHIRYGLFITLCGLGHLVMAYHMLDFSALAMTYSHLATAIISGWVALHK